MKNNNSIYPVAKTNAFKLLSDPKEIIKALLSDVPAPLSLDFFSRTFEKNRNEKSEAFFRRIHTEAQQIISGDTGIAGVKNRYSWLKSGKKHYFFYITDSPKPRSNLVDDILGLKLEQGKLIQTLLNLRFSCYLFSKVNEEFVLSMTDAQSELLLFADVTEAKLPGKVFIEALQFDLFFSKYNELFFRLSVKTFLSNSGEQKITRVKEGGFLFLKGAKRYYGTKELDARTSRNKKFAIFQKRYRGCINYAQQYVYKYLVELLDSSGIDYRPKNLQASTSTDTFMTMPPSTEKKSLKIVNNCKGVDNTVVQDYFIHELGKDFDVTVRNSDSPLSANELAVQGAYLVLNHDISDQKYAGSIVNQSTGERFNTFWQAYRAMLNKNTVKDFDLYTRLKAHNFDQTNKVVSQGINITPTTSGRFKPVNKHIVKRLIKELELKQQVFVDKSVQCSEPLNNGSYELIYIRRPERMFFASVTKVSIVNTLIIIDEQRMFSDEDEFRFYYSYLNVVEYLRDGAFYLYDTSTKSLLSAYTSAAIPQIIGNAHFDSAERYKETDNNLRKLTAKEVNPLPYYINPSKSGQYHQTFIFDEDPCYFYFVAPKGNPQSSFDRQLRVYAIIIWNEKGEAIRQANHSLTELYLASLTDDVLRNNQVSKTSILEKIAKLPIEN